MTPQKIPRTLPFAMCLLPFRKQNINTPPHYPFAVYLSPVHAAINSNCDGWIPGRAGRGADTRSTDQNRGDDEWWHVFEFMLIPRFSSESVAPAGPLTPIHRHSIWIYMPHLTSATVLLSCAYLNFKPRHYVGIIHFALLHYLLLCCFFSLFICLRVNISNADLVALIALGSRLRHICMHTNIALVYRANAKLNGGQPLSDVFVLHWNTVSIRNLGIILFLKLTLMYTFKANTA